MSQIKHLITNQAITIPVKGFTITITIEPNTQIYRSVELDNEAKENIYWSYQSSPNTDNNLQEFVEEYLENLYISNPQIFELYIPPFVDSPTAKLFQSNGTTGQGSTLYQYDLTFKTLEERQELKDFVDYVYSIKQQQLEQIGQILTIKEVLKLEEKNGVEQVQNQSKTFVDVIEPIPVTPIPSQTDPNQTV
jgi:hypothetical protein